MVFDWQLETQPLGPAQNMAADAALLAALIEDPGRPPSVRVYQWHGPAVSIGRLQPEEPVRRAYPGLTIVRRPTGGRAVLHGEDLTIAIALHLASLPPVSGTSVLASHRLLMAPVVAAFQATGRTVRHGPQASSGQCRSVMCFDKAAACDLVDAATGRKVVGSAQRREGLALLQQMSLPLGLLPEIEPFLARLRQEMENTFS